MFDVSKTNVRKSLDMLLLLYLGLLTAVTSKVFNKVTHNKQPSQAPYQTININKAEERCFSICSHNTKLEEQYSSQKSVFYSAEMRDCLDWYNIGAR